MQSTQQKSFDRRTTTWCVALISLLGALFAAPVNAQEIDSIDLEPIEPAAPRYNVELILFVYGDGVATGNEVFPPDEVEGAEPDPAAGEDEDFAFGDQQDAAEFSDRPMPGDAAMRAEPGFEPRDEPGLERGNERGTETGVEPGSGPTSLEELALLADIELRVLPREKLTLSDAFDRLSRLDAYRPVVWTGWTQTVYESAVTPEIRLRRLARIPLEFDGTLKLYLSRYLHLEVDVTMEDRRIGVSTAAGGRMDSDSTYTGWGEPATRPAETVHYRIREDRIVRHGELRYFDHPKFGLLARISRVTEDVRPDDTDAPVLPTSPENPAAPPN